MKERYVFIFEGEGLDRLGRTVAIRVRRLLTLARSMELKASHAPAGADAPEGQQRPAEGRSLQGVQQR